jgi:hypothetical protein
MTDQEIIEFATRLRKSTTSREMVEILDKLLELMAVPKPPKPKFDKKAYMREYMRRWRAAPF